MFNFVDEVWLKIYGSDGDGVKLILKRSRIVFCEVYFDNVFFIYHGNRLGRRLRDKGRQLPGAKR